MPRYDYRCSACGLVYEKREGFDAPSVQECPTCQGQARRVLTPPAIVFKGSGWYVNDSRKSGGSDGSSSSSDSESKSEAKAETKTESKSEAKSDGKSESKSDSASSTPAATAAAD